MKNVLLSAIFIIFGAAASAQTITLHHERIGVGSTVSIRNSDGLFFTHQYIGEKRGIHRWKTYAGKSTAENPIRVYSFDNEGNIVNLERRALYLTQG